MFYVFNQARDPSSLLKSEFESELSLLDSVELSCFVLVSPETMVVSCGGESGSFVFLALLVGGSSGTDTGVSWNRLAIDCLTTRLVCMSSSSISKA